MDVIRFYHLCLGLTETSQILSFCPIRSIFRRLFGVTPRICARLWVLLYPNFTEIVYQVHLLWTMLFSKHCSIEHVNHVFSGAD